MRSSPPWSHQERSPRTTIFSAEVSRLSAGTVSVSPPAVNEPSGYVSMGAVSSGTMLSAVLVMLPPTSEPVMEPVSSLSR